ncbi:MAG: hypothetical protein ABW328_22260 [Ilumatobacteraceae bacterium]
MDDPARDDARPSTTTVAFVVGAAVVVALVRWWVSRARAVFHMNPDEPGQLAIARFVGGGTRWNMFDHSTWRPGYATLISPIGWFTDDPASAFHAALVVNALLGGCSVVLLYLLARRLTALGAGWSVIAALAVSLAPALLFTTDWVWSEALVQVAFLACVLVALRFVERPSLRAGLGMGALAAVGFAAHSRLLPLSVVVIGLGVIAGVRRWLPPTRAIGVVVWVVALDAVVSWYSSWIVSRVWDAPRSTNTAGSVLGRLGKVSAIGVSTAGQIWYQLVATVGLAGIGALALARSARRRDATTDEPGRRPTVGAARLVLVTAGLTMALSIVFMSDRWRPDQLVYGRYNDPAFAPILLAGIGALVLARPARLLRDAAVVVGVLAVTGTVLRILRDDELQASGGVRPMVLGLIGYVREAPGIRVVGITVTAALLVTGIVAMSIVARGRARGALVLVGVSVLLATGFVRTRDVVDRGTNGWGIADGMASIAAVLPEDVAVREKLVPQSEDPSANWSQQRLRSMLYQYYLPHNALYRDGASDQPATPYVFAPLGDPDLLAAGAEVVWRDPGVSIGLWKEPAPP